MVDHIIKKIYESNIRIDLEDGDLILHFDGEIETDLVSAIKNNKAEIINYIKKKNFNNEIVKTEPKEDYAVTHIQKSIWLHSQFDDASAAYNIPLITEVQDINMNILSAAVAELIKRHESLCTVFRLNELGEVRQVILPAESLPYTIDLKKFETEEQCYNYIYQDNLSTFDLEKAPLFRIQLLQVSDRKLLFYLNIHHIICDAWSVEILKQELFEMYEKRMQNRESVLPALDIQYKDYAEWLIKQSDAKYEIQENFWNSKLEYITDTDLLSSKKRPKYRTYNCKTLQTFISQDLKKSLTDLCTESQSTLFAGLSSVFRLLISKYTGSDDVIIGTPYANRENSELQHQIGCFINVLPFHNTINPLLGFDKIIQTERDAFYEVLKMKDFPFDEWLVKNKVNRGVSRNPIFDIVVSFNNINRVHLEESEQISSDEITELNSWPSKFDITVNFQEADHGLFMNISYNNDIYDDYSIKQIIRHYKVLLSRVITHPTLPLHKIEMLDDAERKIITKEFNNTAVDYDKEKTLIGLFKDQVKKTPEKEAVVFEDTVLTFKEIDILSDRFALYLRSRIQEFDQENIIAINLDKSHWMIISMLAILKIGGAYLPIDSEAPAERVDFILKDANCKFVIDEAAIEQFITSADKITADETVEIKSRWDSLAYLIYTSGSTGLPKGVQIENRGVVNHLNWFVRDFNITPEDSTLLINSFAFDGSVTTVWSCLVSGATLHLLNKNDSRNIEAIVEYLISNTITFLKLVPSLFHLMVNTPYFEESDFMNTIRFIKLGGEVINLNDLKRCIEKYPTLKFANHYGTTETSIGSTIFHINKENLESFTERPVIGKPFDNFRIYILDEWLNIVPIGVPGTIHIAGDGVSRGYKDEKLQQEKFLTDICGEEKIYKTGDYGYWNPDGNIMFLGRLDNQVKIRGYRIELEEIENVLTSIEDLHVACVITDKSDICAYIVAGNQMSYNDIYKKLRETLPSYMIPGYIYQVTEIPITSNGKIDKKKLKEYNKPIRNSSLELPVTASELKISKICESIFGIDGIGVDEDFFVLGCNSLKALQLTNRIFQEFGIKVKIEAVFIQSTIKDLARHIDEKFKEEELLPEADEKNIIEI